MPGLRALAILAILGGQSAAQLSNSAYRVLGQTDLRRNGLNLLQGVELFGPSGVAVHTRSGLTQLYIADAGNHRILAWPDARAYQNGDAPALVLGQPARQFAGPLGIGAKGFNTPSGLAVNPSNGDLYVADFNNSRVLRFPDPFAHPSRVEPDAVFGQPDFNRISQAPSKATLNKPRSLAFDPSGNLWIADSGNHRVVRYPVAALRSDTPEADAVIGQKDFAGGAANAGGQISASGFDLPSGLTFDRSGNLYVSDFNNRRVLRFPSAAPSTLPDSNASVVWGQNDLRSRAASPESSATSIIGPAGLTVDAVGNLHVAVPSENRILSFPADSISGSKALNILGQTDFTSVVANSGAAPLASASSLSAPRDVKVTSSGEFFVADFGNNRVLSFINGSKSATQVWGQSDFLSSGPNQVKPSSINSPAKIAIDYSRAPFAIYVADTGNHRVLAWKDSVRFRSGDPADFVIGQPDLRTAIANFDSRGLRIPSRQSLSSPWGLAIRQTDGALFVADSGNHRVLRFPRPVDQQGRPSPDAVLGQADFTSSTSAAVSSSSLNGPTGLALAPDGNLFVSDTENHRVLEFSASAGTGASAIRVYGQPNTFSSVQSGQPSAQNLSRPHGIHLDPAFNLYVADTGGNRVLIFPNTQAAPPAGMAAAFVIGQDAFDSNVTGGSSTLKSPLDVSVDGAASISVADFGNNRVLVYDPLVFLPATGGAPREILGQKDLSGTSANWNSAGGAATAESLFGPVSVFSDRQDTLFIADAGNSRVLHFLKGISVVNSATLQSGSPVAPGSVVSIFSKGSLSESAASFSGVNWAGSLAERQVVVNDEVPVPIQHIGATQANAQIPTNTPLGAGRLAVRSAGTGEYIAGASIAISASSPGLFTVSQDGKGQAVALNRDGRANGVSNPAARGTVVELFGTGQGQVSPPVPDGVPAPADPSSSTVSVATSDGRACVTTQPSMCVAIGAVFGEVQFSGLAPGQVGVWRIEVKIPLDAPAGNAVPLRVLINGTPSNVVTLAIR